MAIPTIILVRHGRTKLNHSGMMRGWTDVPLDSQGIKESKESAEDVAKEWPVTKIYAANLKRVEESARPMEDSCGVKAKFVEALRPWNAGDLAGRKVDDLDKKIAYYVAHQTEKPKGGEPMTDFITRLLSFMHTIFDDAELDGPVVVMTSIRPIEVIMGYLESGMKLPIDPERLKAKEETVGPSGVVVLTEPKRKYKWQFKVWKANKEGANSL